MSRFPTAEDIEFFTSQEAKRVQESWEPRLGDCICDPNDGNRIAILAHQGEVRWTAYWPYAKRLLWADVERLILLPRPHQLWEILEERGLKEGTWKVGRMTPPEKNAYLLADCEVSHDDEYIALCSQLPPRKPFFGPTPSIALGRALLEVIQRGKK